MYVRSTLMFLALVPCLLSAAASAKEINDIQEIGLHQQILTVEKNVNSQNLAVVYTKVDDKCRFVNDPSNRDQPVFDFYWRMDGSRYKPMNSLIKSQFYNRVSFVDGSGDRSTTFLIEAKDLKEVKHDLGDHPMLEVFAKSINGKCDVQAFMNLGPSDNKARIRIDSIYGEGRTFPPAVTAVTLKGEVVDKEDKGTGKRVARRYTAN